MVVTLETPHADVAQILTGHFSEVFGYRAYRRHGVGDWLLIYTAGGRGRFGHRRGEMVANPGDWVLLRPGTLHDYGVDSTVRRWELVWAHFRPRPHWHALLEWPGTHEGLMHRRDEDADIADRFRDMHCLHIGESRHSALLAMNALEEVLVRLDEHDSPLPRGDDRVRHAKEILERRLHERVRLPEVAAAVGLSTSRLAHLFRAEVGQTPQRFLESLRMRHASDLLERTSFSVQQIAASVGFDDAFYFSVRFKAWTGLSPTAFRHARGD